MPRLYPFCDYCLHHLHRKRCFSVLSRKNCFIQSSFVTKPLHLSSKYDCTACLSALDRARPACLAKLTISCEATFCSLFNSANSSHFLERLTFNSSPSAPAAINSNIRLYLAAANLAQMNEAAATT